MSHDDRTAVRPVETTPSGGFSASAVISLATSDGFLKPFCSFVLESAVRLTGSEYGYVAFVDEGEGVLIMFAWSDGALNACAMPDRPTTFVLAETGLWGEPVRQRRPVITNSYSASPLRRGTPAGHVTIRRHMGIPIFEETQVVATAGVANKAISYSEHDVKQLQLLFDGLWRTLRVELRERRHHEAAERLRLLVDHSQDMIYRFRLVPDRCFEYVSPATETITGYAPEEFYANPDLGREIVLPGDRASAYPSVPEHYPSTAVIRCRRKDGAIIWAEQHNVPVYDEAGRMIAVEGIGRDITQQKQAEEALHRALETLQESERRFRVFYQDAPLAYQALDEEGRLVEANPAWCQLLGYERDEVIGRPLTDFLAASQASLFRQNFARFRAQGRINGAEIQMQRRDGTQLWVTVHGRASYDEMGRFKRTHCILQDVTERRRMDDELRRVNRALRTISSCHQALVRAGDEMALLSEICHIAVEVGGYCFAWAGVSEDNSGQEVRPAACAGREAGYLAELRSFWDGDRNDQGPAGSALRTGQPQVISDIASKAEYLGSRAAALERGYRSLAVFPLVAEDRAFGTLAIYAEQPQAFDREEIALFSEMAADLAFGIRALRARTERARALAERDITLGELLRERNLTRNIFDSSPNAIFILDLDGMVVDCNPVALEITGCPDKSALIGHTGLGFVAAEERDRAAETLTRTLEDGLSRDVEFTLLRADGGRLPVEVSAAALCQPGGEPMGFICIAKDLSERRRAEQSLQAAMDAVRQSELKLRGLVEQGTEGILMADQTGKIVEWNPAMEAMTGLTREQALKMHVWDVQDALASEALRALPAFIRMKRVIRATIESGTQPDQRGMREYPIQRTDGSMRTVQSVDFFIQITDASLYAAVFRDVTEKRQEEDVLRASQKLESVGLLAGGVAHDFNNLLTSVLSQASLALRRLEPGHPAYAHIEKAAHSADRAAHLTRQLLAYAGKGQVRIEKVDLNALINENGGLLDSALRQGARLDLDLAPDLPPVWGDAAQLQQVVMNLAINASEAVHASGRPSHEGHIVMRTGIRIIPEERDPAQWVSTAVPTPGRNVYLLVSDTGIGMDPATLERIFDPFFTTKATGRGLGLAALLGIVRSHQGGLAVHSRPGEGTTFTVLFPVEAEPQMAEARSAVTEDTTTEGPCADDTPGQDEAGKPVSHSASPATVLIIDDEEPVREALSDILDMAGIEALAASDGQSGLELFAAHRERIGLVLLDLVMPVMSGDETLRRLRDIDPEVKVVLSSGYDETEANRWFDGLGAQGPTAFLQKPYEIKALLGKVQSLLR